MLCMLPYSVHTPTPLNVLLKHFICAIEFFSYFCVVKMSNPYHIYNLDTILCDDSRRFPRGATIFVVVAMLFDAQTQEKAAK